MRMNLSPEADGVNHFLQGDSPTVALSGRETLTISDRRALAPRFPDHLPRTPYCSNSLPDGIFPREKGIALQHRYLSVNSQHSLEWLTFDVDRPGSYYADDDANLPPANIVAVNPINGRGHLSYLLAKPVHKYDAARQAPREYYAAVQRGMTNRLGADKQYTGIITKNPVHPDWAVEWRRDQPYTLDELNDWIFDDDKRFDVGVKGDPVLYGFSRNVTVFDDLRTFAYKEVLRFKKDGRSSSDFEKRLLDVAFGLNRQFPQALPISEIRATVKSVSKWTWKRFSPEQFSRIQSHRGKAGMAKRWAGHAAESKTKPWEALNLSRATYYRKKKAGLL